MKSYNRLLAFVIMIFTIGIALANSFFLFGNDERDQLYNIEANRLMDIYNTKGELTEADIASGESITDMAVLYSDTVSASEVQAFFDGGGYVIRPIYYDGILSGYVKFIYRDTNTDRAAFLIWQNIVFAFVFMTVIIMLIYIRAEIIKPLHMVMSLPEALAKGDFTTPVKAQKSRFFGRFVWGLDMLRDTMLSERQKTLALEKEKSQASLAISHDIKTPLSAIVLCSKALRDGLYSDEEKQNELLIKIDERALEIQTLVQKFQESVSEDMLDLPVEVGEFYLDDVINRVESAYRWRMELTGTEFTVAPRSNCLLKGDGERAYEALCNLIENAMKYGDGKLISVGFSQEDNCLLITVINTGNTLPPQELIHMFDSFWRGSNTQGKPGSGLGLFIARKLCVKMGGEAFAVARGNIMETTLVFRMY